MTQTAKHIEAVKAYNKDKYARLYIFVSKDRKREIEAIAAAQGESLNKFVETAIDERIERLKGDDKGC
jgi:predicted HicB family RNase H-like nuclease